MSHLRNIMGPQVERPTMHSARSEGCARVHEDVLRMRGNNAMDDIASVSEPCVFDWCEQGWDRTPGLAECVHLRVSERSNEQTTLLNEMACTSVVAVV
jgi:hypothetical protein